MPNWTGHWAGGRIYTTSEGRNVYVIERRVHRKVRAIPLRRATSERDALAELALFDRDPVAFVDRYERERRDKLTLVTITPTLVTDFLQYLADKGTTTRYRQNSRTYLDLWSTSKEVGNRDLRRLKLADLQKALKKLPAQKKAIIAIKSFCSWLVDQGTIEPQENPTTALRVPPSRRSPTPKGYGADLIAATYSKLSAPKAHTHRPDADTAQAVRDVYALAAMHGLHFSEIERIANDASITVIDPSAAAPIAGTVTFLHKNGTHHIQSLTPQTLRAALRLQARKQAPVESCVRQHLARAAKELKKDERLRLGQLRHSFVTIAKTSGQVVNLAGPGVPLAAIAQSIGHRSITTTSTFYDNSTVPTLLLLPITLHHADDPVIEDLPAEPPAPKQAEQQPRAAQQKSA